MTLSLGGDLAIDRLGYGAMRLTHRGWGPPADLEAARETLRTLSAVGVTFVDTSNAYGPFVSELLIREVLHPYRDLVIATKGGILRPGPTQWVRDGRPEALRAAVLGSLKVLGVERLDLWQLHDIDPAVPLDEQFAAIAAMQREGLIRHVGLSNATVAQVDAAGAHFRVASVQCVYNVIDRTHDDVLARCERDGIPFIAYYPLATGALAAPDSILGRIAGELGITAAQAALAWLLKRSKVIVAIPGTSQPAHLRENAAAARIVLTDEQFAAIDRIGRRAAMLRQPRT